MNNIDKVKLLRKTQQLLRDLPEQFSPYETCIPGTKGSDQRGCICSYLCKAYGFESLTQDAIYDEARALLRGEPVDELFNTEDWPEGLEFECSCHPEGSLDAAQVACNVIDNFIKTYYSDVQE